AESREAATGYGVFGPFALRGYNERAVQAGVPPPHLTRNAVMFVDSNRRLSKNLAVAIVNPNDSPANIALTLRKNDGTQLANTTINVPSHQQTSEFLTQLLSSP